MKDFEAIYKILAFLDVAMDYANPPYEQISPDNLGISEERRTALIIMLADNDYLSGVEIMRYIGDSPFISYFAPTITIKGLEYLETNPIMQRLSKGKVSMK